MRQNIIGRNREINRLVDIYNSQKSEFVAVCGRRRVGKTFLVKELFEKELCFSVAGVIHGTMKAQLKIFTNRLERYGMAIEKPVNDWFDAFNLLAIYLSSLNVERKVVLLDELPWFDTSRSNFVAALENFWNDFVTDRHDIVLIVCGSATSWMMDNLINNHGGLHNRLTASITLEPFNLYETELMLSHSNFHLSRYELAECYMVFGGVPYYLSLMNNSMTLSENIDYLLFDPRGELYSEFDNLYKALFKNSDNYVKVVKALSEKRSGLTRNEIISATSLKSGDGLTTVLKNLEACGFVRSYSQPGCKVKDSVYQMVDFFTLFYYRFKVGKTISDRTYWSDIQNTSEFYVWAGITFELLVLHHVEQIKQKLRIPGVASREYVCRIPATDTDPGTQIDLVIDRKDNNLNICEIKFSLAEYEITSDYEAELRRRIDIFRKRYAKPSQSLQLTFVTTFGLKKTSHSWIVNKEIVLDDLFRDIE